MIDVFSPITTKARMYELLNAGVLGNTTRSWSSIESFLAEDYQPSPNESGLYALRSLVPGGKCVYRIPAEELSGYATQFSGGYNLSPMQRDNHLILQGELTLCHGFEAYVSRTQKPMREALAKSGTQLSGIRAVLEVKGAMDGNSWDWLNELLDRYPGHVVEFSTYSGSAGVLGWNTLTWETRLY